MVFAWFLHLFFKKWCFIIIIAIKNKLQKKVLLKLN
nr:MAG TPA: hypothetical protein [Caudoviricetes sp.]